MRIASLCTLCKTKGGAHRNKRTFVAFTTNPVATMQCAQGHRGILILADGAHSLLFERAICRLVDEQTRDAVIDAHTALEMYLAHVPARARYDAEAGASPAVLRNQLRKATSTSDRALAAALTAVSIVARVEPPPLPSSVAELRNAAVHQGEYPSAEKVEKAIVDIDGFVRSMESLLGKAPCANEMRYWQMTTHEQIVETTQRMKREGKTATAGHVTHTYLGTVLSTAIGSVSAADAIKDYRDRAKRSDFVAHIQ